MVSMHSRCVASVLAAPLLYAAAAIDDSFAVLAGVDSHAVGDALGVDDECVSEGYGSEACSLSALQLTAQIEAARALAQAEPDIDDGLNTTGCAGAWCYDLLGFTNDFDTNDPAKMQVGVDKYAEYMRYDQGIKVAVTEHAYYLMYHGNVKAKLSEYLPQGLFGWDFEKQYTIADHPSETEVTLVRDGTITFNLGSWKRNMFWNMACRNLPDGVNFNYSHVKEFNDCDKCPAKMVVNMKKGGLSGTSQGWKITEIQLIKLK